MVQLQYKSKKTLSSRSIKNKNDSEVTDWDG